jgi:hypothetical protein
LNRFVRTILMTAFEIDDNLFRDYTKKKIINGFLQKPIGIHDLIIEVIPSWILTKSKKNIHPNVLNLICCLRL